MDVNSIFKANRDSTERLRILLGNISINNYSMMVGENWNVSDTFAHLLFWDQRALYVLESAEKNNELHAPYYDDQLNDILTPILRLIPAENILRNVLSVSEKLDNKLMNCSKNLLDEVEKVNLRIIDRSIHRNLHLDEIEAVVIYKALKYCA
jgi:hypothetical protein